MLENINAAQIRAARGLLGWALGELAERCSIRCDVLAEIESAQRLGDASQLDAIASALKAGGILFLEDCATVEGG